MRIWRRLYAGAQKSSLGCRDQKVEKFVNLCNNHKLIYQHRSSKELLRWYFLLWICGQKLFAKNAFQIFEAARQILGPSFFSIVFKPFVYNLFIAGNDRKSILKSMRKMHDLGLIPFLSPMLEDSPDSLEEDHVKQAQNVTTIMDCISMCSELSSQTSLPINPLAIKLTAFIGTPILEELAKRCDQPFDSLLVEKLRTLNLGNENSLGLDLVHCEQYLKGISILEDICTSARENDVVLFIDAEYSHLQPAVRLITLTLMMEFNRGNKICIANTYQCYLKAGLAHLEEDLRISCNMSFPLGIKLVRGAYMEVERRQSFNKGLRDPICANYALTNEAYDKAVQRLLRLAGDAGHLVVFATHNFDSVKKIAVHSNLPKSVYFAQINGMADPISFGLIHSGHQSLKLIPCGSVADVVPWLARRVQENSVALERVSWDKLLIHKELYRRLRNVIRK